MEKKTTKLFVIVSTIREDDYNEPGEYISIYREPITALTLADCQTAMTKLIESAEPDYGEYIDIWAGTLDIYNEHNDDESIKQYVAEQAGYIDPINEDWAAREVHYNYESIADAIMIHWVWSKYIGYARRFEDLSYCLDNDNELICRPVDRVGTAQCSVLLYACEVAECRTASELVDKIEERANDMGKWQNSQFEAKEFVIDLYERNTYGIYKLPEIYDLETE